MSLIDQINSFVNNHDDIQFLQSLLDRPYNDPEALSSIRYLFLMNLWNLVDPKWSEVLNRFYDNRGDVIRIKGNEYITITNKLIIEHWGEAILETSALKALAWDNQQKEFQEKRAKEKKSDNKGIRTGKKKYKDKSAKTSTDDPNDNIYDESISPWDTQKVVGKKTNTSRPKEDIMDNADISLASDRLQRIIKKQRGEV